MKNQTKISKQMAYLLRHNPSGMQISSEGFVDFEQLLKRLQDRRPELSKEDIREVVERDPKGRYEIKGNKIRARYGHSIDANPTLTPAAADILYHGTTPKAAEKILEEGLKTKSRQKVHLSATVEDAIQVGKRRTDNPVILEVNVKEASGKGVNVERASDKVYVADEIPAEHISRYEKQK